jgi:parvulin-like peptidyl-prolyl isomerase
MSAVSLTPQRYAIVGRGFLALAGLTIALMGSDLTFNALGTNNNVLVLVNQQPISLQQLNFAAQRLTGASADTLDNEQKNIIVKLLIDEELLLQRAELLGIACADPGIRKALARAVIDKTADEFLAQPIAPQQLKDFHLKHQMLFTQPMRIKLQAYKFVDLAKAQQAFESDPELTKQISMLPPSALPVHMLRRYLGIKLTDIALRLEVGETSRPISQPDGVYLLTIVERQPEQPLPFAQARPQVEAEYQRRGRDAALQKQLIALRQQADIRINQAQVNKADNE